MRPERDPRACSDCGFLAGACECDSLRGDAERYGSERTATLDGDLSQRYVTEGIESGVEDLDRGIVGHVGLFDIDESGRERALTVARRLPGPVAVLRSSRRSWHLWALPVRPLDEWLDRADDVDGLDQDHLEISESRDCAVLRVDAKVRISDGETVAPEPVLRGLVDGRVDGPLSEPHADLLVEEFDLDEGPLRKRGMWVGDSLSRRVYMADIGGRS